MSEHNDLILISVYHYNISWIVESLLFRCALVCLQMLHVLVHTHIQTYRDLHSLIQDEETIIRMECLYVGTINSEI